MHPARQIARRVGASAVVVILVVLAAAGSLLAGGYAGTWSATESRTQLLLAGAPLRAEVEPVTPALLASAGDRAVPVAVAPVVSGEVPATLIAGSPEGIGDLLGAPLAPAGVLDVDVPAVELPIGATGLRLTATAAALRPGIAAAATARAWVMGPGGAVVAVPLAVSVDGEAFSASGDLPDGAEDVRWRLTAVELARGTAFPTDAVTLSGMSLATVTDRGTEALDVEPASTVALGPQLRSALAWSAAGAEAERPPALVTTSFATALGAQVGDDIDLRVDGGGRRIDATVAAIVDTLPRASAAPGVFVPLDALVVASTPTRAASGTDGAPTPPQADEVWASGDADALAEALGVAVVEAERADGTVGGVLAGLWAFASAAGAALAGVALASVLWSTARRRAGEVLVLRALGIAPAAQARLRAVETAVAVGLSAVLGVAGGAVLSWLLLPALVSRTVPDAQTRPALVVDPLPVLVAVLVLAVGTAAAVVGGAAIVRRQAASARAEDES